METKKYEAFIAAVEMGSFSKAADKVGVTQSGLTHMMNALENEVGFPILIRSYNGVRATPNGEKLIPAVKNMLKHSQALQNQISIINEDSKKTIFIGAYTSVSTAWVLPIIKEFRKDYSDINVEIRGGTTDETYEWVREGLVDLSFVSNQHVEDLDWVHLEYDPLIAVTPENYPIITEKYPIEKFDNQEVIMPYFGFEKDVIRELDKYDVHPIFRPTQVDDEVIIKMVEIGLGISIMSDLMLKDKVFNMNVMHINPPTYRDLGIVVRDLKSTKSFVREFIKYAQEFVKKNKN